MGGGNSSVVVNPACKNGVYAKIHESKLEALPTGRLSGSYGAISERKSSRAKLHNQFIAQLTKEGFARILPGEIYDFDVQINNTSQAYVTIYEHSYEDRTIHPICVNLPKAMDADIVLNEDGHILQASVTDITGGKD